jgi:hypothetical protein
MDTKVKHPKSWYSSPYNIPASKLDRPFKVYPAYELGKIPDYILQKKRKLLSENTLIPSQVQKQRHVVDAVLSDSPRLESQAINESTSP